MAEDIQITIFKGMSDFVFAASNIRPYLATKKFTPPLGIYLTLNIINIQKVSQYPALYNELPSNRDRASFYSTYKVEIELRGYGSTALMLVQGIIDRLRDKTTRQVLSNKGLGYSDATDVRNISININDQQIEERASSVLSLYFVQGGDERLPTSSIDTVTTDPTYIP